MLFSALDQGQVHDQGDVLRHIHEDGKIGHAGSNIGSLKDNFPVPYPLDVLKVGDES